MSDDMEVLLDVLREQRIGVQIGYAERGTEKTATSAGMRAGLLEGTAGSLTFATLALSAGIGVILVFDAATKTVA